MSKTLFIGGPLDGERIKVDDHQHYYKCGVGTPAPRADGPEFREEQTIDVITYVRIQMTNGMTVFTLDDSDPVVALIANYEPKLKSRIRDLLMEFIGSDSLISKTGWGILDKIKNATKY